MHIFSFLIFKSTVAQHQLFMDCKKLVVVASQRLLGCGYYDPKPLETVFMTKVNYFRPQKPYLTIVKQ